VPANKDMTDDEANELYLDVIKMKDACRATIQRIIRMATADGEHYSQVYINRSWLTKIEMTVEEYAEELTARTATAGDTIGALRKRLAIKHNEAKYLKEQLAVLQDKKTITDLRKLSNIVKRKT